MKRGKKRKQAESPHASPPSSPPPPSPQDSDEEYDDEIEREEYTDDQPNQSLPNEFMQFALSVVSLANGNVSSKVPPKKKDQFKARLRDLTARIEQSLADLQVPTFSQPNFDSLPASNKRLKEAESSLKHQLADMKYEITQQRKTLKESQQYLEDLQEKSDKVKKMHKNAHKGKLHQALQRFPESNNDPYEFSFDAPKPKTTISNLPSHNMEDSFEQYTREEDEEEEDDEDRELEEIKRKLAPKLAEISKAQRSGALAVGNVSLASDMASVLISVPAEN